MDMVELTRLEYGSEPLFVKDQILRHFQETGSEIAEWILGDWNNCLSKFVRVIPTDYQTILDARRRLTEVGTPAEELELAAFAIVTA